MCLYDMKNMATYTSVALLLEWYLVQEGYINVRKDRRINMASSTTCVTQRTARRIVGAHPHRRVRTNMAIRES